MSELFVLDNSGVAFAFKKIVTSAIRRIAPIGLATTIGWSANLRALRWVIEMRTHPSAEEEIRLVFGKVAAICCVRDSDFTVEEADGLPWYKAGNSKV